MLIARETKLLLVNHQLIPITIQPKSISLEQICYKKPQGIAVTSLHCLVFCDVKKQRSKTNLERCYQCSVSTEISLDLKFCCFPRIILKLTIYCTLFDQSGHWNFCTVMIMELISQRLKQLLLTFNYRLFFNHWERKSQTYTVVLRSNLFISHDFHSIRINLHDNWSGSFCFCLFFFYEGFPSQTLTIHGTEG